MALEAKGVSRRFFRKTGEANFFNAVERTDFLLPEGTLTVLMGRSGSGKTTLLNMLAGLLTPSEGQVLLDGTDLYALPDKALSRLRNQRLGVIPQGQTGLHSLTVLENVAFPAMMYGGADATKDAAALLERFGIGHLRDARPSELSGGELRRMAIARALINRPAALLADEPTGDLDDENTVVVLEALRETARGGAAVLMVTHEAEAASYADRLFRMDAGALHEVSRAE